MRATKGINFPEHGEYENLYKYELQVHVGIRKNELQKHVHRRYNNNQCFSE